MMTGARSMRRPILQCIGVLTLGACSLLGVAIAEEPRASSRSQIKHSQARSSISTELDAARLATDWGLQVDEWVRYQALMEGPLGVYSPNLDPLTALGIESRSAEERRHYAELQVQIEGRRVEKLIAYQRAYDQAWKRLYPDLQPIARSQTHPADLARRPSWQEAMARTAVFVRDDCLHCTQRVQQLQATGGSFDIYVVGSLHDDTRIRQWAMRAGLDSEKVRAGVITLNHDSGRWQAIGDSGDLPAVMREINGRWQRD